MEITDLGRMGYGEALELQKERFEALVAGKLKGEKPADILYLVEHEPVVTLGRRAKEENVLFSEDMLRQRGIELFHIRRGGDVTYHGPGQIVAYPIIDLDNYRIGVKEYVERLEEAVIRTLERYGIKGERVEGATGVWIGKGSGRERKISAIGVKCSRFCTMHGLALNVGTDLSGFNVINPCGFTDKGVTSISLETGRDVSMEEVKENLSEQFRILFQPRIHAQGTS